MTEPVVIARPPGRSAAGGVGPAPSGSWRVARTIARVEGPRLVRHPLVLALAAITAMPTVVWWSDGPGSLSDASITVGVLIWAVAAGVLIASNLAVRRARRDACLDVFDGCVVSASQRAVGHLLALVYPVSLAALLTTFLVGAESIRGGPGSIDLLEAATAPVLVAGAGVIGVVTGRWIPSFAGSLIGLGAVFVAEAILLGMGSEASRLRWLAPWVSFDQFLGAEASARDPGWHLLYLAGLIGILGALAAAGRKGSAGILIVGVVFASTGAVAQTRQLSPLRAAAMAALFAAPESCVEVESVRFCAPRGSSISGAHRAVVAAVLRAVPAEVAARGLVVRSRPSSVTIRALPAEVRAQLPAWMPRSEPYLWSDGAVHIDQRAEPWPDVDLSLAVQTASWAVGLPFAPRAFTPSAEEAPRLLRSAIRANADPDPIAGRPTMLRCNAAHQARAVVALWLAGQAGPATAGTLLEAAAPGNDLADDGISHRSGIDAIPAGHDELVFVEPAVWGADMAGGAMFAVSDIRYASELLGRAGAADAIAARWAELTHPDLSTHGLVRILGLTPLPAAQTTLPYDPVEPACA